MDFKKSLLKYNTGIAINVLCCSELLRMGGTGILFQLTFTISITVSENRLLFTIHVAHIYIYSDTKQTYILTVLCPVVFLEDNTRQIYAI